MQIDSYLSWFYIHCVLAILYTISLHRYTLLGPICTVSELFEGHTYLLGRTTVIGVGMRVELLNFEALSYLLVPTMPNRVSGTTAHYEIPGAQRCSL